MAPCKIILSGCCGRLGSVFAKIAGERDDVEVVCGVDINGTADFPVYKSFDEVKEDADVLVDISHHSLVHDLLAFAEKRKLPVVICTTGHTDDEDALIRQTAKNLPILKSRNMSLGINLLMELVRKTAAALGEDFDIEVVEAHHSKKLDAPSGTAKMLASSISSVTGGNIVSGRDGICPRKDGDIGVSAVRGGNVKGIHEITFYNKNDTFTITHTAESRGMFAEGALSAAVFVADKKPGLYDMDDLYGDIL